MTVQSMRRWSMSSSFDNSPFARQPVVRHGRQDGRNVMPMLASSRPRCTRQTLTALAYCHGTGLVPRVIGLSCHSRSSDRPENMFRPSSSFLDDLFSNSRIRHILGRSCELRLAVVSSSAALCLRLLKQCATQHNNTIPRSNQQRKCG
jgi:hypothetical protein